MEQRNNPKEVIGILNKNIHNQCKSITESLCPKYRKFSNFPTLSLHPVSNHDAVLSQEDIQRLNTVSLHMQKCTIVDKDTNSTTQIMIKHLTQNQPQSPQMKMRRHLSNQPFMINRQSNEQKARQQINSTYRQLNQMISDISSLFEKRMKTHQDEMLKIMITQIQRLNEECARTITKYNQLIRLKECSSEPQQLRVQTELYKRHALSIKQENEQLKKEIQYLKRLNNEYELKIKTDQQTLKSITKKLLHYKRKLNNLQSQTLNSSITKSVQHIKEPSPLNNQSIILSSKKSIVMSKDKQNQKEECLPQIKTKQSHFQTIIKSQLISCTKSNSRSLDFTLRSNPKSIQKSVQSLKITHEDRLSQNRSLQNTLMIKLNNQINNKYKSSHRVDQLASQQYIKLQQKDQKSKNIKTLTDEHQSQPHDQYYDNPSMIMNRQKVVRFLKQTRPSIKSMVNQKKSIQRKRNRQLINEDPQNRITAIKNRVRLSSFDYKQFLDLKNSLQLSLNIQTCHQHRPNQQQQ